MNDMKDIISRQKLSAAIESYNHSQDASLLPGLSAQMKQYMDQHEMRRRQLQDVFRADCSLEQALASIKRLPAAADYYLMGCYLLAQCEVRRWDADVILEAMKTDCGGCISWLSEDQKDFVGRIALHRAASFLTKEQLIRTIELLDGYYLHQDILNRIAGRDEPKAIAVLRKRLVGRQPAMIKLQKSEMDSCRKYKDIDDAGAFALFEKEMTEPRNTGLSTLPDDGSNEAPDSIEIAPSPELYELFALIKKKKLASGTEIMHWLCRNYELTAPLGKPEDIFLSFVEHHPDSFEKWFEEAWKVLCCIGRAKTASPVEPDTFSKGEEGVDHALSWYRVYSSSDERIARSECYLVKLLRIVISRGTSEQVTKILSFLTPAALARHPGRLASVNIPLLYSVLKANGYSYFALHTVISSLDWSKLSIAEMSEIAACMLDDPVFLSVFRANSPQN